MAEYRTHSFNKDWHEKVEQFIEENDLAFDSPKYFIKFCVNKYMDEYTDDSSMTEEEFFEKFKSSADKFDFDVENPE